MLLGTVQKTLRRNTARVLQVAQKIDGRSYFHAFIRMLVCKAG